MIIKYSIIIAIMLIAGCTDADKDNNKKDRFKQTIDSTRTSKDVKSESSITVPVQKNPELAQRIRFARIRRNDLIEAKSYLVGLERKLVLQKQIKNDDDKMYTSVIKTKIDSMHIVIDDIRSGRKYDLNNTTFAMRDTM